MPQIGPVGQAGRAKTVQYWLRTAVAYIAAAVVITLLYSGVGMNTPWRAALTAFAISLTFSCCIGMPATIVMPRLGAALHERVNGPMYWVVMIAALLGISILGSVCAIALLIAVAYIPPGAFDEWFFGSMKVSVIATLTFGVFATAYETLRARLEATTVALRTKERDEAESRRLAAEAQLASLESRVNPHFFFNTLNSIAALVHDDPSAAERMTMQLAALFRASLNEQGAALVPLDDELRIVQTYLDIERVRFGNRLKYRVESEPSAAAVRVPRLAVQTLVENSVKYAVGPSRTGAEIVIRTEVADCRTRVSVLDDGPGFDTSEIPDGHGLALLRARLVALFGDRAALRISSAAGRTAATIEVPCEPSR